MNIEDIYKISAAIITSVGGAALLIAVFSTWLGKVWANRILEKDKLKYTSELETIKSKLQRESERQKVTFSLYFEGQFKLYNELWIALSELQNKVDELWELASNENLKSFIKAVVKAKKQIRNSAILIEKNHYEKILENLDTFENYKVGKESLIVSRNISNLEVADIDRIVEQNQQFRTEITEFTQFMLEHMRNQIKGS